MARITPPRARTVFSSVVALAFLTPNVRPCLGQPGSRRDMTTRIHITMGSTHREDRALAGSLGRAARRIARTAERWAPALGLVTIQAGGTELGDGAFSTYSGDADPYIVLPLDAARRVARAMVHNRDHARRLESSLVAIGLHELGHVAAFRYGLQLGDRGEQFADDYSVVLAARTHHAWLIELAADYLDREEARSPVAPGAIHLGSAERTRRLRCLARAAGHRTGPCLDTWRQVERDMTPYFLPK